MPLLRLFSIAVLILSLAGCREENLAGDDGGGGGTPDPVIAWKNVSDGIPVGQSISPVFISPLATLIGTPNGLLRLEGSGVTWLPTTFSAGRVEDILYDEGRQILLARTATELYRSPNGTAWVLTQTPVPFDGLALGDDGAFVALARGSRYVSSNGGSSWTPSDLTGLSFDALELFERVSVGDGALYFASPEEGGLYYSDDAQTWSQAPALGTQVIRDVASDSDGVLYAAPASGSIYRSAQGAAAWAPVGGDDLAPLEGLRNALVVNTDDELYLATSGDGIYFSEDRGDTWASYRGAPFEQGQELDDRVLALALTDGDFLYASTSEGRIFMTAKSTSALK